MFVHKKGTIVFLKSLLCWTVLVCLYGCGPMDSLLPSTGTYKVNVSINRAALEELSFFDLEDEIQPYFEGPVLNDPDVTALVLFLRNSRGDTVGRRVAYTLQRVIDERINESVEEDELSSGDEFIIAVKSLDGDLPVFPLPDDLPIGRYTLVSHVMSGKSILQRIEKNVYYMGKTDFSYNGIQLYMPGIAESPNVIPRGMVVMLETVLDFDSRLNPYVIWYNGRRKISEGYFSDGAGYLLWKAPEQSGFYSLRAEVFPAENFNGLSGYQKEISLLVSSKAIEVNLITENISQLSHWYTFEGNLNDSKMISSMERAIKPNAKNIPHWAGANGTYGLITGSMNVFSLPKVSVLNNAIETWQVLFRFNPLNDGVILSVQFDNHRDVFMNLKVEDNNLVLELVSSGETVSQTYALPERSGSAGQDAHAAEMDFIKAGFIFSIPPEMLAANINVVGGYINKSEFIEEWTSINVEIKDGFQILLGHKSEDDGVTENVIKSEDTAIWDEFALYYMPSMEILDAFVPASDELAD